MNEENMKENDQISDVNDEKIEYVTEVILGKDPVQPMEGADFFEFNTPLRLNSLFVPLLAFIERYNSGSIQCGYKYSDYIVDKDVFPVVEALGFDTDKFWRLLMFCYDYVCDVCFDGSAYASETPYDQVTRLLGLLNKGWDKDSKLMLVTKNGKASVTLDNAFSMINKWIAEGLDNDPDQSWYNIRTINDDFDCSFPKRESSSVAIWHFAMVLKSFFSLYPEFKGKSVKGGVSLNRNILISNLVYRLGFSKNRSFLNDDETLRGFIRQYKGKRLTTVGRIYSDRLLSYEEKDGKTTLTLTPLEPAKKK